MLESIFLVTLTRKCVDFGPRLKDSAVINYYGAWGRVTLFWHGKVINGRRSAPNSGPGPGARYEQKCEEIGSQVIETFFHVLSKHNNLLNKPEQCFLLESNFKWVISHQKDRFGYTVCEMHFFFPNRLYDPLQIWHARFRIVVLDNHEVCKQTLIPLGSNLEWNKNNGGEIAFLL